MLGQERFKRWINNRPHILRVSDNPWLLCFGFFTFNYMPVQRALLYKMKTLQHIETKREEEKNVWCLNRKITLAEPGSGISRVAKNDRVRELVEGNYKHAELLPETEKHDTVHLLSPNFISF